jgi:site-specific recombinase XerD
MSYSFAQALTDWQTDQRKRRRQLSPATIASYSDAWQSFSAWAATQQRQSTNDICNTDLADWINSLRHLADGSIQTYSHGVLAICRYLADRKHLACDLAVLQMHLSDSLPRMSPGRAPDVADLRRLVTFYDAELPAASRA